VPWDIAAGDEFAEREPIQPGKLACLSKGQNLPGIKRERQLRAKTRYHQLFFRVY
jgi:hypothetical protein